MPSSYVHPSRSNVPAPAAPVGCNRSAAPASGHPHGIHHCLGQRRDRRWPQPERMPGWSNSPPALGAGTEIPSGSRAPIEKASAHRWHRPTRKQDGPYHSMSAGATGCLPPSVSDLLPTKRRHHSSPAQRPPGTSLLEAFRPESSAPAVTPEAGTPGRIHSGRRTVPAAAVPMRTPRTQNPAPGARNREAPPAGFPPLHGQFGTSGTWFPDQSPRGICPYSCRRDCRNRSAGSWFCWRENEARNPPSAPWQSAQGLFRIWPASRSPSCTYRSCTGGSVLLPASTLPLNNRYPHQQEPPAAPPLQGEESVSPDSIGFSRTFPAFVRSGAESPYPQRLSPRRQQTPSAASHRLRRRRTRPAGQFCRTGCPTRKAGRNPHLLRRLPHRLHENRKAPTGRLRHDRTGSRWFPQIAGGKYPAEKRNTSGGPAGFRPRHPISRTP